MSHLAPKPYRTVKELMREYAIDYLTPDESGYLRTPGTRYGGTVSECATVAFALASILRRENSEDRVKPFTDTLDEAMGLVVNNSDDVLNLIREHGSEDERETVEDVIRAEKIAAQKALGYDEARRTTAQLIEKANRELAAARHRRAITSAQERIQLGYVNNDIASRTEAQFDLMDAALGQERR